MTGRIAWAALVLFALLPGLARADRIYWVELDWGEIQRINCSSVTTAGLCDKNT